MSEERKSADCCADWTRAQQPRTDNEGYGRLVYIWPDGTADIGSDLPPVRFCPWCGASKERKKDADNG